MADFHIPDGWDKILAALLAVLGWGAFHIRRQARMEEKIDGVTGDVQDIRKQIQYLREQVDIIRNGR